ncbi:MAG: hypothetical protein V1768_01815 [Patescibacteria group bacterium]|nr:hypothetical protein [Patescibacteria group bacterium]MBU0879704.1 hypothetical protein [Patescibacteria group bacterium]MBU0880135.1 hypothetical protein [Patescibacteria group bacterium]MBU0897647.1 hypothetical protein [Patescibacteria group bacterium]MBU1063140.1 hypothetical protein [Patescibacteria group bacterium]
MYKKTIKRIFLKLNKLTSSALSGLLFLIFANNANARFDDMEIAYGMPVDPSVQAEMSSKFTISVISMSFVAIVMLLVGLICYLKYKIVKKWVDIIAKILLWIFAILFISALITFIIAYSTR